MRRAGILGLPLLLLTWLAGAAEVMPPAPARYFNDYAGVVSAPTAEELNNLLREFERTNSSQVVVAVFPKMQSDSSIEDFVRRMAVAWRIGQKQGGKNNGVLLAVFTQDRRVRIEVGYGLEGALPDAMAKRIIDDEITPHFKRGSYDAGLTAGVNAILAATKGEYKASSRALDRGSLGWFVRNIIFNRFFPWHLLFGYFFLHALGSLIFRRGRRGTIYDRRGRRRYDSGTGWGWFGGSSSGGGWSSGGGGGGGDGGGFSGGGGDFGGGGASGSW